MKSRAWNRGAPAFIFPQILIKPPAAPDPWYRLPFLFLIFPISHSRAPFCFSFVTCYYSIDAASLLISISLPSSFPAPTSLHFPFSLSLSLYPSLSLPLPLSPLLSLTQPLHSLHPTFSFSLTLALLPSLHFPLSLPPSHFLPLSLPPFLPPSFTYLPPSYLLQLPTDPYRNLILLRRTHLRRELLKIFIQNKISHCFVMKTPYW